MTEDSQGFSWEEMMSRQGAHTLKTRNDLARTIQSRYKHPNPYTRPVSDGLPYWQLAATSGNDAIARGRRTVPSAARYRLHDITVPYPLLLSDTQHDSSIGFKPAIDIVSDNYLPKRPDLIALLGSNID